MYEAEIDPYCYPGTTVLKNIPGIQEQAGLDLFQTAIAAQRAEEPLPSGRLSVSQYRAVRRHLFQDVYSWAGRFRTVRISRSGSMFCYPENIGSEMNKLFAWLRSEAFLRDRRPAEFATAGAHFLSELNAIHPFRDGNGRAQLNFMALLAAGAGLPLDFDQLDPEAFLAAMIRSFRGDEAPLAGEVRKLLR
jgi:cell filamentation protein